MPLLHETLLLQARTHAESARFAHMLDACQQIVDMEDRGDTSSANALLDVGALLLNFGFLARASHCFERARALAPTDLRPLVNLANLARDAGNHAESRRLYSALQAAYPDHPVIRRNFLVSQEYDPTVTDAERLQDARAWDEWASARAGGERQRPLLRALAGRPLRVGYVSADFCQHTVGLFVKDVLAAHDAARVMAFAYSAGALKDGVTAAIAAACQFRDVAALGDAALADTIRGDQIDVLVDLSGHTAGSRLAVFAHRPAPVQIAWLGYFASTGLACMDAVLLDDWHAPPGTEAQFVEPVIRLPTGRFCYQPVPWAPAGVGPLPCLANGHITFGCFNNTAKFNNGVFDVWARVLAAVPGARLVLKWRTFADEGLCQSVRQGFAARGIAPERIELRGASFHADMLGEYADIDIALDPFPFTGGLSSCEALWMGVPVISWPQSRVVSRQTFAFLSAMGLTELAAQNADDYVAIARSLAADRPRLAALRAGLRARMQASPLMKVAGFTRQLEASLHQLFTGIAKQATVAGMSQKTILHVGPGHQRNGAKLPQAFQTPEWKEVRIDIDPANEPDIVGSMLDMAAVATGSVDALYSAHNIEHVYAHEVPVVLTEFLRVLKPDGFALITCPDLQSVCALIAQDKLTEAAYQSQAGAISPLDILYGHGPALAAGHHYMAHKCGFTEKSLRAALQAAGFQTIAGKRRSRGLDLWMLAAKGPIAEAEMRELAGRVLPG